MHANAAAGRPALVVLLLLAAAASVTSAQTDGPGPAPEILPGGDLYGREIVEVRALGATSGLDPVGDLNLKPSEKLSFTLVRNIIRRLWDTGDYADIKVRGKESGENGVILIIDVLPRMRLSEVEIKGESDLDEKDIEQAIDYYPDRIVDPKRLDELKDRVLQRYQKAGFPDARVVVQLQYSGERGRVDFVVRVEQGDPVIIDEVKITGAGVFSEKDLISASGLSEGERLDRIRIPEARNNILQFLRNRGYRYASVTEAVIEETGEKTVSISFDVRENDLLRIVFNGNRHMSRSALMEVIELENEDELGDEAYREMAERIQRHYVFWGFMHASVSYDTPRPYPGLRILRFIIEEGIQVEVDKIVFDGNEHFSNDELENEVFAFMEEKVQRSAAFEPVSAETVNELGLGAGPRGPSKHTGPLPRAPRSIPAKIFEPDLYMEAMDQLAALYASEGYLQAQISEPRNKISDDGRKMTIYVSIREGPRTQIRRIMFKGNSAIPDVELAEILELEEEDALSIQKVEEERRRLLDYYNNLGYIYAAVSFRETGGDSEDGIMFSRNKLWADVVFNISEGPQTRVSRIIIRGNTSTSDYLIRDRLTFSEGDIYSPQEAADSKRHLMQLGIFDSVTIEPYRPDEPAPLKTIVVRVREHKPQMLELRPGFSTGKGARGAFEYVYRNIFGYAVEARLLARANYRLFFFGTPEFEEAYRRLALVDQLERHILVGIGVPNLPGMGAIAGVRLDAIEERINEPYFGVERISGYLTVDSKYFRNVTIETRTGLERSNLDVWVDFCGRGEDPEEVNCVDVSRGQMTNPKFRALRLPEAENALFWVNRLKIDLDFRDNPFNTTKGFYGSTSYEWVRSVEAILVEDAYLFSNLGRFSVSASGYIPMGSLVLALSARYGLIHHLQEDSTTFPDRYFYLGGINDVRGFAEEAMPVADPEDAVDLEEGEELSPDEKLRILGGETEFVLRAELRIPIGGGFSIGLFSDAGNIWRKPENFDIINLRPTAGLGIRYQTPVGPLAFDYGFNLDRKAGEDPGAFHFSIGLF